MGLNDWGISVPYMALMGIMDICGQSCIPGATALPMNRGGEGGKCPCDFSVIRDQNKKRRSAAEVHLFCMPRGVKLLLREQNLGIRNTSKKRLGC